ncbi:AbrB family transcriptional regulator [Evansella halocellulosilytica]|uniref:AbrB family transcriptional regulator n=1 Tax=Evansella halocellulosilytica TaxID=2011013 RepID=UPI000BB7DD34|nr:AbrB family transcriptional regulator [Evansella halocellulosilytica]
MKERIVLIFAALTGGTIGWFSGIPLGVMLGAAGAVVVLQSFWRRITPISSKIKKNIQSLIGGLIGLNFSSDLLHTLSSLWKPALLLIFSHILVTSLVVLFLNRFLKWDLLTAACSAAPAGISEIVVITDGLNLPMNTIISTHLFRLALILVIVPLSILLFI